MERPTTYLACPAAFTAEECERVIALAGQGGSAPGPVHSGSGYAVDRAQRDVHSVLVARGAAEAWLFDRLDALFARAAAEFELPVGPIGEAIQILRYEVGCHFATWHTDSGFDLTERRRISLSVELSERGDYEGGELEIVPDRIGRVRDLPRGSVQLFPSRALHRVTPVSRGRRWALVAWTGAPEH